jgi:hypothetical protein
LTLTGSAAAPKHQPTRYWMVKNNQSRVAAGPPRQHCA